MIRRRMVVGMGVASVALATLLHAEEPRIRVAVYDDMGAGILAQAVVNAPQKGIRRALVAMPDVAAEYVGDFNRSTLDKYDLLVLCQTGHPDHYLPLDWVAVVRDWVEAGHGLYVTHDAVGYRKWPPLFPSVAVGESHPYPDRKPYAREWCVAREHPLTQGLKLGDRITISYFDTILMAPNDQGAVVMRAVASGPDRNATSGDPALVCGEPGQGRYVANGAAIGALAPNAEVVKPIDGELQLLRNAILWLAKRDAGGKISADIGKGLDLSLNGAVWIDPEILQLERDLLRDEPGDGSQANGKSRLGSTSGDVSMPVLADPRFITPPARATRVVQGLVFADTNGDGQLGAGEQGLPEVVVSDGLFLVATDDRGRYQLTLPVSDKPAMVFVETPAGYKAGPASYYQSLPGDGKQVDVHFGLMPAPERGLRDFTFLQISDTHVGADVATAADLELALKDCAALKPAFIMATGDMTDNYQVEQFETFTNSCATIPIPVFPCVGNHDVPHFEKYFGPTYYAFDAGQAHFVVLNSEIGYAGTPRQMEWLKRDLAMQPTNTAVFVFQHRPPATSKLAYWGGTVSLMEVLALHNVKGLFTGHWHSSKVFRYADKVLSVNTPPLCFGGLDAGPRGFVRVTVQGVGMALDQRVAGCRRAVTVVRPAPGAVVAQGAVTLLVNAYDAAAPAPTVECRLDDGAWQPMTAQGKWSWQAAEVVKPGAHRLAVRVRWSPDAVTARDSAFTVAASAGAPPRPGSDWPMFKHDAARTSHTDDAVRPPLRLAWHQNLAGTFLLSSPVMANGRVYVGVADEDNAGHAGIAALDARSGARLWTFPTPASIKHTVAVADDLVYAVSVDGMVYALDALNGERRWTYSLGSAVERWAYAAPLVDDGVVYVGVAPKFVALDAATGRELWQAPAMGGDWISSPSSPASDGTHVVVTFNRGGGVFALDKRTGRQAWQHAGLKINFATPAVSGELGALYQPSVTWLGPAALYALSPNASNVLWSSELINRWPHYSPMSSPAVSGDHVYLGSPNGDLLCLNRKTGDTMWTFPSGKPTGSFAPFFCADSPIVSSPALSGNVVYFGTLTGRLQALAADNGARLWSYELGAPILSSPAVSGNMLFISAVDGTVYAFTSEAESLDRSSRRDRAGALAANGGPRMVGEGTP